MSSEKLCAFCIHFDWEAVGYNYISTLTGGEITGGASCMKGVFFERNPNDAEDVRTLFLTAKSCEHYETYKGKS